MTTEENLTPAVPRGVKLNLATIFWVQVALASIWFAGPLLVSSVTEMAAGFDFPAWVYETNRAGLAYVMVSVWVLALTLGFYVVRQIDYVASIAARESCEVDASKVQDFLVESRTLPLNIARFALKLAFSVWFVVSAVCEAISTELWGLPAGFVGLLAYFFGFVLMSLGRHIFVFSVAHVLDVCRQADKSTDAAKRESPAASAS